jgi:hypothetical protein
MQWQKLLKKKDPRHNGVGLFLPDKQYSVITDRCLLLQRLASPLQIQ